MTIHPPPSLLARAVAQLKNWLFRAPRRSHQRAHPDLNPINIDEIATELRLLEEGGASWSARDPNTFLNRAQRAGAGGHSSVGEEAGRIHGVVRDKAWDAEHADPLL